MAKIVIISPSDVDVSDAIKLLKGAGHDVEVEEPTPKSLLHIVLGLMGPNAYGFGPGYAYAPGPQAADDDPAPSEEEAIEDEATADPKDLDGQADVDVPKEDYGDDSDFNFESLGKFSVDGEMIKAFYHDSDETVLVVQEANIGPRTTYKLNESQFAFWPADSAKPLQRVDVGAQKWHTSLEVVVQEGEQTRLMVGRDLLDILAPVKPE